jgi:nicotinate-nucleotide--dimethylbenzimidazole phosphoribosyltransferase
VPLRSIFLSRFFIRCVEVAGAGVVSALCAYFLSQIQLGKPAAAPPQAAQVAQVSQVALAAGESVRVVEEVPAPRVEAAPVEAKPQEAQPQKDEPPKKPESTATAPATPPAPAAAPAPKPAKPAQTAQPRREPKPRAAEPVQPPVAAAPPVAPPAQTADAAPPPAAKSSEDDRPLFERLKLVPSWFSAKSDKPAADKPAERPAPAPERPVAEVPRPPMPVGDALRNAM